MANLYTVQNVESPGLSERVDSTEMIMMVIMMMMIVMMIMTMIILLLLLCF